MRCHEVMKTNIATCWLYDPIANVAARMRSRGIGFMPVCDDNGDVIGTITDRDLVVRAMADRLSYDAPAHRVMSTPAMTCSPHDDIERAEDLMRRHYKSRIVCVDQRGRPVGVISLSDIADVEHAWRAGKIFRDVAARETHAF